MVTFDYANHVMYLKPLAPGPLVDIGNFDPSGMWINQAKGGMQVMDVTAGGPAAHAGIEAGDVITAVDGRPAASLHLYDVRQAWRDEAPGTVVHLALRRGAQARDVALTLRGQI